MADYSDPKRGVAYRFTLSLFARSGNQIKTVPTLAAGDVKVSKDNGATANITTLPAETPASSGILQVDLSAAEMTADLVTIIFRDAAGAEWNDVAIHLAPSPVQMGDLATAANLTVIDDLIDTEIAAIKTVVDAILVDTDTTIPATLATLATQASVTTIDDFLDTEVAAILAAVDTEVAAIKAKTDLIPAAPSAVGDIPTAAAVADAVWDEVLSGHLTAGSTGNALNSAGSAGDPWGTALPGAYGAGSAGYILGTNLDATVSTRATAAALTVVDDFLDTEIAAILAAVDTEVATIVTQTTAANIRAAVGLASANLDTQIGDIPTNAELATSQAAADDATLAAIAALSIPTAAAIADAVWDEDATAHQTQGTFGQAIGDPVADTNSLYKAVVTDATGATVGVDVVALKAETVTILADTNDIQTRLPAALVSGRMDASVGAMAASVLTATAIAADAITDAKVAADVTIASVTGAVGSVTGAVGSVTGNVGGNVTGSVGSVASGGITATSIAADAIGASELAADAVTEIAAGVWDRLTSTLTTVGSAGKLVVDNLNAAVSSRASQTSLDTVDDFLDTEMAAVLAAVDTEVAAIKAKTDSLTFTVAGQVDANTLRVGGTLQTAGDIMADTNDIQARLPAALVSGRMDVSVGAMAANVMTAAAAAADLTTELQSGLATAAALTTVAGYIDTEVASILAAVDTEIGTLQTTLNTVAGYVDTEVAAIKAKTDLIPAAPAAVGDIPTAAQNAAGLLDLAAGVETGLTLRQTLRLMAAVMVGKVSGAGTGTEVFRDVNDTKARVTATVDLDGNRTAITRDAT